MERRDVFRILTATAIAAEAQTKRCLSDSEFATLQHLCDMLLPSDEQGPGAKEARLAEQLDAMLLGGDERQRNEWSSGLALVDDLSRRESGAAFTEASFDQKAKIMDLLMNNERFFTTFKNAAVPVFAASKAGREFLGYSGDSAVSGFLGCTHPEHR